MKSHKLFINLHVILAGFFLIPAIMFSITGALYTFKITGTQKNSNWDVTTQIEDTNSLANLVAVAEQQLKEKNLSLPTGSASIKKMGTSWSLEWTGTSHDFILEPTAEANIYKAILKEASLHRYFVQLHKAKGGFLFKFMSAGLAIAFILLFASGVALALRSPELKSRLFISFGFGLGLFCIFAYLS